MRYKEQLKERKRMLSRMLSERVDTLELLLRDTYKGALQDALFTHEGAKKTEQALWSVVDRHASTESRRYKALVKSMHNYEQALYVNHYQFFESLQKELHRTQDKEVLQTRLDSLYRLHQLGQYYLYNTLAHHMTTALAIDLIKGLHEAPQPTPLEQLPINIIDWFTGGEEDNESLGDEKEEVQSKLRTKRHKIRRKRIHDNEVRE